MADLAVEAESKLAMVTFHPMKVFYKLRERYSEDTADVFFVDKETQERLPAHREVLKVNSDVFFKMFNGDWKEKEEKEIPAPEEYSWESIKAAITLLYGEEVEVEESSIPDIYRVAHCYELKDVIDSLAQVIRQWGSSRLATVMKLHAFVGELEAGNDQLQNDMLQAVMQCLARILEDISRESLAGLSYQTVLRLVQSEDIQMSEVDLLSLLQQWIKDHPSLTIVEGEKLLSHVRLGTFPHKDLLICEVGHRNLSLAHQNFHQLCLERVKRNVVQVTPRLRQKYVFQVFPVAPGISVSNHGDKWECSYSSSLPAVGVMYFGRQELSFEGSIKCVQCTCTLVCELATISGDSESKKIDAYLQVHGTVSSSSSSQQYVNYSYEDFRVIFNQTGARLVLQNTIRSSDTTVSNINKSFELPFSGPFPWMCTFGLTGGEHYTPLHTFTFTFPAKP